MTHHRKILSALLVVSFILMSCNESNVGGQNTTSKEPTSNGSQKPTLNVVASTKEPGSVEFVITTNLPTPLAAMASLELQGQKDDDTAIGTSQKVTLTGRTTTFSLKAIDDDNGMDGKSLPRGSYDADVIVGPKWAENESISNLPENLEAKQTVELGIGRSRASAENQDDLQKWVVENVPSDAPWNARKFRAKLGPYEKSKSTLSSLHDTYFFPNVNITLIVNRLRQDVSIWRIGRVTE